VRANYFGPSGHRLRWAAFDEKANDSENQFENPKIEPRGGFEKNVIRFGPQAGAPVGSKVSEFWI